MANLGAYSVDMTNVNPLTKRQNEVFFSASAEFVSHEVMLYKCATTLHSFTIFLTALYVDTIHLHHPS